MGRSIKGCVRKALIVGFLGAQFFCGGHIILNDISELCSESIRDQAHLVGVLQEEKEKLGIPDKKIYARFGETRRVLGHAEKIGEDSYEIILDPVQGRKIANLRHELYHIYDGHVEGMENSSNGIEGLLKRVFVYEPQALVYQVFGIRL
jgi:hypothetical protein